MFVLNTRSKTSIFVAYAFVSVVGFAGLWLGTQSGNPVTALEAFLAFYSFLCTTVVFYLIAGQKSSMDHAYDMITHEANDRSREIEKLYNDRSRDLEGIHRRLDEMSDTLRRDMHDQSEMIRRDMGNEIDSLSDELERCANHCQDTKVSL